MARIILAEQASPSTPSANMVAMYPKAGGLWYGMGDDGVEYLISGEIKTILITRELDAASGDVAYTGVTFKPSTLFFIGAESGSARVSIGMDDLIQPGCIYNLHGVAADTWGVTSYTMAFHEAAGKSQHAIGKTMDADGFTLTWTRTGVTSAGTIAIFVLCLR